MPFPALPFPALPFPALPFPALPFPALPFPALPCYALPCHVVYRMLRVRRNSCSMCTVHWAPQRSRVLGIFLACLSHHFTGRSSKRYPACIFLCTCIACRRSYQTFYKSRGWVGGWWWWWWWGGGGDTSRLSLQYFGIKTTVLLKPMHFVFI